ncbi:MAG: hypothetical protein CL398_08350 [Acidiferrobacteraceae bacterium]|nr:hypothetical protein [Acidiferrobacteraceae bacterium]
MSLQSDLELAVKGEQLELHYQPQFDLQTARVVGAEALLRWNHPEHGVIPPNDFIPLAEDTGLIFSIGRWVVNEACRQSRLWRQEGFQPITISVNISAVQLQQSDFYSQVREAIEREGIRPYLLGLEVTESLFVEDMDRTISVLKLLKDLGVELSLDDFGTGYSSLSYLTKLPIDKLKIDQSFIRSSERESWAIVRTIIQLARSLGLKTVGEGIEEKLHVDRLCDLGCHIGQGYHYSRPAPANVISGVLPRELLEVTTPKHKAKHLRIGLPADYLSSHLQATLHDFQNQHSDCQLDLYFDFSAHLLDSLSLGELDVVIALDNAPTKYRKMQAWSTTTVWIASQTFEMSRDYPLPVILQPTGCPYRSMVVAALNTAETSWHCVYQSPEIEGVQKAVASGMGVAAVPSTLLSLNTPSELLGLIHQIGNAEGLPELPPLSLAIYDINRDAAAIKNELVEQLSHVINNMEGVVQL